MNPSPLESLFSAAFPSLVVGLLLLVFQKELYYVLRELPLNRYWESRWARLLERKLLLEDLHDKPSELLLWFLRTLATGIVCCFAFFSVGAFLQWHDHLPMHVTRWILMSVFFITCSMLPTLYRLSAYDHTMKRLNEKIDKCFARIAPLSD